MWSKITPGNKSTLIGIAALLLFVGFIVAFFVRTVVKATRGLPLFRLDDILLAVASVRNSIGEALQLEKLQAHGLTLSRASVQCRPS